MIRTPAWALENLTDEVKVEVPEVPIALTVPSLDAGDCTEAQLGALDALENKIGQLDTDIQDMEDVQDSIESVKEVATESLANGGLNKFTYVLAMDNLSSSCNAAFVPLPAVATEDIEDDGEQRANQVIKTADVALEGLAGNIGAAIKEKLKHVKDFINGMLKLSAKLEQDVQRKTPLVKALAKDWEVRMSPEPWWVDLCLNGKFDANTSIGIADFFKKVKFTAFDLEADGFDSTGAPKASPALIQAMETTQPMWWSKGTEPNYYALPGNVLICVARQGDNAYIKHRRVAVYAYKTLGNVTITKDGMEVALGAIATIADKMKVSSREYSKSSSSYAKYEKEYQDSIKKNGAKHEDTLRIKRTLDVEVGMMRALYTSAKCSARGLNRLCNVALKGA